MENKCYYLSSCSTCKRILAEIKLPEDTKLIDLKMTHIDAETLDFLAEKLGSYESLLNKRAQKLKNLKKKPSEMPDGDLRSLILEEYTFLKRPIFLFRDNIFVGNATKEVQKLKDFLAQKTYTTPGQHPNH